MTDLRSALQLLLVKILQRSCLTSNHLSSRHLILQLKQEPRLQRAVSQISEASVECFHVSLMSRWGCLRSLVSCLSGFKGSESPNWTRPKEARSLEESRADAIRRGSKRFKRGRKKSTMKSRHSQIGPTFKCGLSLDLWYRPDSV